MVKGDRKVQSAGPRVLLGRSLKAARRSWGESSKHESKRSRIRFARLSLKFAPDANPVYLERTLAAMQNAAIPDSLKLQVCYKAFADSSIHCGTSIADVLGNTEAPLPEGAVQIAPLSCNGARRS